MFITAEALKAHPEDFRVMCDALKDRAVDCQLPAKTAKLVIRSLTAERVLELYRMDFKSFRSEMAAMIRETRKESIIGPLFDGIGRA